MYEKIRVFDRSPPRLFENKTIARRTSLSANTDKIRRLTQLVGVNELWAFPFVLPTAEHRCFVLGGYFRRYFADLCKRVHDIRNNLHAVPWCCYKLNKVKKNIDYNACFIAETPNLDRCSPPQIEIVDVFLFRIPVWVYIDFAINVSSVCKSIPQTRALIVLKITKS